MHINSKEQPVHTGSPKLEEPLKILSAKAQNAWELFIGFRLRDTPGSQKKMHFDSYPLKFYA